MQLPWVDKVSKTTVVASTVVVSVEIVGKKFVLLLRNCIVRKGAKHIQFELADREKKAKLVMVS